MTHEQPKDTTNARKAIEAYFDSGSDVEIAVEYLKRNPDGAVEFSEEMYRYYGGDIAAALHLGKIMKALLESQKS